MRAMEKRNTRVIKQKKKFSYESGRSNIGIPPVVTMDSFVLHALKGSKGIFARNYFFYKNNTYQIKK